ncbi:MAG: DUF2971 domain-containing protein [Ignavibacteria bacterium]|jgi:hypothetical protein|nr:DUF2971 domain-containing protein [Ignavibacteria bacterium]MCU7522010.1 DUF2971 domain-containing protein [Ignavibacteria bacterium]
MCLYKYTSADVAIQVLSESQIRFTQPHAFNDPFDSFPCVEDLLPKEQILSIMNETEIGNLVAKQFYPTVLKTYYSTPPEQRGGMSFEQFESFAIKLLNVNWQGFLDIIHHESTINQLKQSTQDLAMPLLWEQVGILSLSKKNNDLLMWSYYADSHKGVVFGFNADHHFLSHKDATRLYWSGEVEYVESRPSLEIIPDQSDPSRVLKELFYFKYELWKHEQEYRVVRLLRESKSVTKNGSPYPIYLFDFPPDMITSITFGCRINAANKNRIFELIKTRKEYEHITLHEALPDRRSYKLSVNKL